MPKPNVVKRGSRYLRGVDVKYLEVMVEGEKPGKSRDVLQAAVLRKRDKTLGEISNCIGHPVSTIHGWLARLESGGLGRRYDNKSPGRPPRLTDEEQKAIGEDLDKSPTECGFGRGNWNSKMVVQRIWVRFGKVCSRRSASGLARKLGFSYRKPRPIPYNSATPEEQEAFIEKAKETIAKWASEERIILALDAASLRDSPTSRRGLRRRGGRDTVPTNYSRKSLHVIGALGNGTLDIQFHENLSADSYIALIEYVLRHHKKKIGIVCDNANALTGKDMRKYLDDMGDAVEMLNLLPHTPQLNPIEIQWREIKAAIADRFFGGLEKMRDAIIHMLHNKEIPIVKLYQWMLSPE